MDLMAARRRILMQDGANLYRGGTLSFTLNLIYPLKIPLSPGTYSMSALVTTTDTDASTNLVILYKNDPNKEAEYAMLYLPRGSNQPVTFTITDTKYNAIFYASTTYSKSRNDSVEFKNIRIVRN